MNPYPSPQTTLSAPAFTPLRVETHIAGSYCVVWGRYGRYIDARRAAFDSPVTHIEVVQGGHVYKRLIASSDAPALICALMRSELT
jgi:hypothetical protein